MIREAEANRLATLENKPQARAALLPQLTATGGVSIELDSELHAAQLCSDRSERSTRDLVASDTHDHGRRRDVDAVSDSTDANAVSLGPVGRSQARRQASGPGRIEFKAAQQDLLARTAQRYFDVLAAEDTLEAAQATLEAFSRQLEQADKRFEVGLIAITDVQEARAARDQASAAVIAAKRTLATTSRVLARTDRRDVRRPCRRRARICH